MLRADSHGRSTDGLAEKVEEVTGGFAALERPREAALRDRQSD